MVRIERTFAASAKDVFDAWTSPEVMRRWLHPAPDWETPEAEVDLRVGGKVRVVMRRPDGSEIEARGEYTLIDRPRRLVMTWTFSDDPSNEQLMEVGNPGAGTGRATGDHVEHILLWRVDVGRRLQPLGPLLQPIEVECEPRPSEADRLTRGEPGRGTGDERRASPSEWSRRQPSVFRAR